MKEQSECKMLYSEDEYEACKKHYYEQIGPLLYVCKNPLGSKFRVDIFVIGPTTECPCQRLVTCGMGAIKMNIPKELQSIVYDRVEIIFTLPYGFAIKEEDLNDETFFCPAFHMLLDIALTPYRGKLWLSPGHRIFYNGDCYKNPDIEFVYFDAPHYPPSVQYIDLPNGKTVRLLEAIPVFYLNIK